MDLLFAAPTPVSISTASLLIRNYDKLPEDHFSTQNLRLHLEDIAIVLCAGQETRLQVAIFIF